MGRPLCTRHPVLYRLSVLQKRACRYLWWAFGGARFAGSRGEPFPETVLTHRSLLVRKLAGTDPVLQRNKVTNLAIAAPLLSGTLVRPGETFSFWKLVGRPVASRGFLPGLQLSMGSMQEVTGGGLCQLSNLLHWMLLHSEMTFVERHRHGFDAFPDYRRTVPFGSGATVFYNYHDLMCRNGTDMTYHLAVWLDDEYVNGRLTCDTALPVKTRIVEKGHRFVRRGGETFRENELWRVREDRETGALVSEELIMANSAVVRYDPEAGAGATVEEESAPS
jgi:vancomycin resistance protein VanW